MALPKTNELMFRSCDQKWWNQANKIEHSTVAFFVNPPEGVEHGQKCVESKTDNTLSLKTFPDLKLSFSAKNIFLVKKNHNLNIVFFLLLDLHSKKATIAKRVVFW